MSSPMRKTFRNSTGYSFLEVLVGLALAAVAISAVGTIIVNYNSHQISIVYRGEQEQLRSQVLSAIASGKIDCAHSFADCALEDNQGNPWPASGAIGSWQVTSNCVSSGSYNMGVLVRVKSASFKVDPTKPGGVDYSTYQNLFDKKPLVCEGVKNAIVPVLADYKVVSSTGT